MKLRNKKTGKRGWIAECNNYFIVVYPVNEKWEAYSNEKYVYHSLSEVCEDWEDVKEPLIKDEKMRKFVRDWAEMNGISEIIVFDKSNSPYIPAGQVVFAEDAGHLRICFKTDEKFDTDRIYSVPELCGEEE